MTDQLVLVIYHGYIAPWAGALTVGRLFLLMLSVFGATIFAGYLWTRVKSREE
jgi:hypothetical protein